MPNLETDLLELPHTFDQDPEKREKQLWQAMEFGYKRVLDRFGKLAATPWPAKDYTLLASPKSEVILTALVHEGPSQKQPKFRKYKDSFFKFQYDFMMGKIRMGLLPPDITTTPMQTAVKTGMLIVHLWAGENQIKPTMDLVSDPKAIQEAISSYCACEALGLINPPITRLPQVELLVDAYKSLLIRQIAVPLGENAPDILFRITQGQFSPAEIMELDEKLHFPPTFGSVSSFYHEGLLHEISSSAASRDILYNGHFLHEEGSLAKTLDFVKGTSGKGRLEFLERADVVAALELYRATRKVYADGWPTELLVQALKKEPSPPQGDQLSFGL